MEKVAHGPWKKPLDSRGNLDHVMLGTGTRERKISWGQTNGPRRQDRDTEGVEGAEVWGGDTTPHHIYIPTVVSPPHPTRGSGGAQNEFGAF